MRDLFHINDYIRLNSSDFKGEIKRRRISFNIPTRNVRYWMNRAKTPEGFRFRRLLEGESLLVVDNKLMVELPESLAREEIVAQMVQSIFGEGCTLPIPKTVAGNIKVSLKVDSSSVKWVFSGRVVTVTFDSSVSLNQAVSRLNSDELDRGLKISSNELFEAGSSPRVLYEVIVNPDGIECICTKSGYYIITKSTDEAILRRKFFLMYGRRCFGSMEVLYNYAQYFKYGKSTTDQRGVFEGLKRRQTVGWLQNKNYYEVKQRVKSDQTLGDMCRYVKSLDGALAQCQKAFDSGECYGSEMRFATTHGYVEISLENNPDLNDRDYLHEGLETLRKRVSQMLKFLEEDLAPSVPKATLLENALLNYAFTKVCADPLLYTDFSGDYQVDYHEFAEGLI